MKSTRLHKETYDLARKCSKEVLAEVLAIVTEHSMVMPQHVAGILKAAERQHLFTEIEKVKLKLTPYRKMKKIPPAKLKKVERLLNKTKSLTRRMEEMK